MKVSVTTIFDPTSYVVEVMIIYLLVGEIDMQPSRLWLQNALTASFKKVKTPPPTSVMDITLMVRIQSWS